MTAAFPGLPFSFMHIAQATQQLVQHWQPLRFDPTRDRYLEDCPAMASYREFYGLTDLCARAHHGFGFVNVAGDRICTQYWLPPKAQGTLFVLHGYYDHVGLYARAVEFGLRCGLAVVAFDLPGHGLSDGERAVVDDFAHYTAALSTIFDQCKRLSIPGPNFGLAQSTGCAVLLKYQMDKASWFQAEPTFTAQVFLAPLVRPAGWRYGRWLHWLLNPFIRNLRRTYYDNSHNPDFLARVKVDPLQPNILSLRWLGAMKQWIRQVQDGCSLDVPTLMVQGTEDATVDWHFNIPLLCTRLPRHHIYWLNGGRHQLINESDELCSEYLRVAEHFVDSYLNGSL